jgi:hypothetical protein
MPLAEGAVEERRLHVRAEEPEGSVLPVDFQ